MPLSLTFVPDLFHFITHKIQHLTECHDPLAEIRRERGEKIVCNLLSSSRWLPPLSENVAVLTDTRIAPSVCVPPPVLFTYVRRPQGKEAAPHRCSLVSKRVLFRRHQQGYWRLASPLG
jgi:hypothetical protein